MENHDYYINLIVRPETYSEYGVTLEKYQHIKTLEEAVESAEELVKQYSTIDWHTSSIQVVKRTFDADDNDLNYEIVWSKDCTYIEPSEEDETNNEQDE